MDRRQAKKWWNTLLVLLFSLRKISKRFQSWSDKGTTWDSIQRSQGRSKQQIFRRRGRCVWLVMARKRVTGWSVIELPTTELVRVIWKRWRRRSRGWYWNVGSLEDLRARFQRSWDGKRRWSTVQGSWKQGATPSSPVWQSFLYQGLNN